MDDSKNKPDSQPVDKQHRIDAKSNLIAESNLKLANSLERILLIFNSDAFSFGKVANEMQKHEIVAEQLLKRVNSVEFSLEHSVDDVQHAVAMLGQNKTIEFLKEEIARTEKQTKRARRQKPKSEIDTNSVEHR